jgi:hypothetical protein
MSGIWGKVRNGPTSNAASECVVKLLPQSRSIEANAEQNQASQLPTLLVAGTTIEGVEEQNDAPQLPTLLVAPMQSSGKTIAKDASPGLSVSSFDLDSFLRDRSSRGQGTSVLIL